MAHPNTAELFIAALTEAVEEHRSALRASRCATDSGSEPIQTKPLLSEHRVTFRLGASDGPLIAAELTPGRGPGRGIGRA